MGGTSGWVAAGLAAAALLVTGVYDLGHFDHNDFQYGVAPVLLAHLRLYRDFSFDQTPLQAWVGLGVLKLVGARRLYLALRLISLLCIWAVAAVGMAICRGRAALLFLLLFVAVHPLVVIGGEIGNYSLSLLFFAGAVWVFLERPTWAFAVGLLAGCAASEKLSYIYDLAAFGVLYLLRPPRLRNATMYSAGALAGLAPVFWYLARFPRQFWFENFTYHYLINIYRGVPFHIPLWPLEMAAVLVLIAAPFLSRASWRLVLLLAAAMAGVVTPGILFPQYWAPADFLFVLIGVTTFGRRLSGVAGALAWGACGVAALVSAALMLREAAGEWAADAYGVVAMHRMQNRIIAAVGAIPAGCHGGLVSAFAAVAVGSNTEIAPISSEGPFMMRLDPVFASRAGWFRDYSDVSRHLEPGSLILTGYDPGTPYENAMRAYAASHGFREIALGRFLWHRALLEVPDRCGT